MPLPNDFKQMQVSCDAAEHFVKDYYAALNTIRKTLSTFYIHPNPSLPLKADIVLNGNIIPTPAGLQRIFVNDMPKSNYVVQCYDAHVLNPNFNIGARDLEPDAEGSKCSLMLMVSGSVSYGTDIRAPVRGFTETFVLVPNFEMGRTRSENGRKWLIYSQNFQLVT